MSKQEAAALAVTFGTAAANVVNECGIDSPQGLHALAIADTVAQAAVAVGCTKADFDAEHARRGH